MLHPARGNKINPTQKLKSVRTHTPGDTHTESPTVDPSVSGFKCPELKLAPSSLLSLIYTDLGGTEGDEAPSSKHLYGIGQPRVLKYDVCVVQTVCVGTHRGY